MLGNALILIYFLKNEPLTRIYLLVLKQQGNIVHN